MLEVEEEDGGGDASSLQGILSPCSGVVAESGGSGDDDLAVLPRNTKVIVTGNNRTKSLLIGLHGVVKKAVGLGGWHWLVLTNGLEVKLQRNALSVIETPPINEEDDNDSEEHLSSRSNLARDSPKPFKPRIGIHKHSALIKPINQGQLPNFNLGGSKAQILKINFREMDESTLMRYWRHYNLVELEPSLSKEQLVEAVERHFVSQKLDELQAITNFVQAAKRLKNQRQCTVDDTILH